jgi:hypothetical protein
VVTGALSQTIFNVAGIVEGGVGGIVVQQ